MCTGLEVPILAASLGASAGGTMLSRNEADQNAASVMNARNAVLKQSLAKQKQFADENAQTLSGALTKFTPDAQAGAATQAVGARNADATAAIGAAPDAGTVADIPLTGGNAPQIVKSEIAGRMLDAFKKSSDLAKARAQFGGYGDVAAGNNVGVTDASRKIDTVNNFAKGQISLLPAQQELAGYLASKPSSGIGQMLSGAGQLGAMYAGAGAPGMSKLFSGASAGAAGVGQIPFYGVGSSPY